MSNVPETPFIKQRGQNDLTPPGGAPEPVRWVVCHRHARSRHIMIALYLFLVYTVFTDLLYLIK